LRLFKIVFISIEYLVISMKTLVLVLCALAASTIAVKTASSRLKPQKSHMTSYFAHRSMENVQSGSFSLDKSVNKELLDLSSLRESARSWFKKNSDLTESLAAFDKVQGDFSNVNQNYSQSYVWFPLNEAGIFIPYYLKAVLGSENKAQSDNILKRVDKCSQIGSFHALFPYTYSPATLTKGGRIEVFVGYIGVYCKDSSKIDALFYTGRYTADYNGDETDASKVAKLAAAHTVDGIQQYLNGNC